MIFEMVWAIFELRKSKKGGILNCNKSNEGERIIAAKKNKK
jgi:hypothetical protein